jgi:pimeloyl-ACP methyl ester carboxylesterase
VTATAEPAQRTDAKPTIVLVHGAFADGSSWNRVIERLQHQGYSVIAPAVPLRGLAADSAYLASVVNQLDGPVLLVGHSYAGALITNTAADAANVVGLVFVAAFAPDTDERLGDVAATSKDSLLGTAQVQREYPTGPGGETAPEFLVDPVRFREVFAADLPAEQAAVLAATQRPVAAAAFSDVSGPPAWKTLPSWALVATADEIVEVDASHVVMVSQPQAVTELILQALHAVS